MMPDPSMMMQQPPQGPMGMNGMGMPPMPQGEDPSMMMGQPPVPPEEGPMDVQDPEEVDLEKQIDIALRSANLAKGIDKERLNTIGDEVIKGYEIDKKSCKGWLDNNKKWLSLSLLLAKEKTYPWKGAANVKYPLVTTAAMQFTARAYPTLIPADNNIVKPRVIGKDPDGSRADRADRIAKHMSYQIMHKMPCWEEDMDRLLFLEAIFGVCFKKTFKDPVLGTIVSKLITPENLIVNYWARSLDTAYRKTEHLYLTKNEIETKVRNNEFLDIIEDLGTASVQDAQESPEFDNKPTANDLEPPGEEDSSTPHLFLGQHTFYDIDEDGYEEPVIIVVHYKSGKVARILPRFDSSGVKMTADKKKIVQITPIEYFTDFQFITNPDGSIYGLGFGSLLGPTNEAVNSLINQLIDSGTINNLQSGFLAKGLRVQMKDHSFVPGEWKEINAIGEDLKNSIFPLPTKEPSNVLFQLMTTLIQAGNQLASVAEIFVGKMPGQNTPATTTQETVDQAMKVFTSIYKRNYRSLLKEFQKIYNWNRLSPEIVEDQASVLNEPLQVSDYDGPMDDIIPAADPSGSSSTAQFSKMNMILQNQLLASAINPQEYTARMLKLIEIPDPQALVAPPAPPPPDPKIETEKMKQETMQQKAQLDSQAKQQDMQMKQELAKMEMAMKQMEMQFKQQEAQMELARKSQEAKLDMIIATMQQKQQVQKSQMDMAINSQKSQMDLQHKGQMNNEALRVAKEKKALAPKKKEGNPKKEK